MIGEQKIEAYGCSFSLISCSIQLPYKKPTFHSPRKDSDKISLSRVYSDRSITTSSQIFNPVSDVALTQSSILQRGTQNVGVQTARIYENVQHVAHDSESLPLYQNKSILARKGSDQEMGRILNQLNQITLYEKNMPKRQTVNSEIPHFRQSKIIDQRRINTQQDQGNIIPFRQQNNFDLISKQRLSSKTCQNSIIKNSQVMFTKPLLKRSQMQQTGFSKDFSRQDVKNSGQYYAQTIRNPQINNNIVIAPQKNKQQERLSSPSHLPIKKSNITSSHNHPLSPACSNKIKTLIDLDCKSVNSCGNGDKTSSYHVSIAASLNSSSGLSKVTEQDRIFRTLKQMTLKNIPEQGGNPKIFANRFHQ